ncbi:MAG TPA: nucleotidyltransferase [Pyrinomonadaceae bacterium]|nr:nucleotidyltransferase [Pyrinomonadaceae bacterium]
MIETELDVLRDASRRLESAGIPFMLTGSVAMNYYAQPRMTRDIDLVVSLNETQLEEFFRVFESEYYFDRRNVTHAVAGHGMFNLIHTEAVIKVDCVVLKPDTYRQEEFARRKQINLGDFKTWIVSREDLILSKLFWAKDSKSEMQLGDVSNLLSSDCDMEYLRSRAKTLQVDVLLEKILGHE